MEDSLVKAGALQDWHRSQGGYLHPSVELCYSSGSGLHWWATANLEPGTLILSVPHSLALSYLNALVDETFPVFKSRRNDFGGVEAIGFWYLMIQWINREKSFWRPYLDLLPTPESDLSTPLFFDSPGDEAWIEGTDVLHSARQRLVIYERQYQLGLAILGEAGIDTRACTWRLYKWAVTMFTSRSFSSGALRPADSKYWSAYRSGPSGSRQTVILDISTTAADDLDFPVLFPTMDAGNHDPTTPVDWTYDPGRFSVTIGQHYQKGQEVFNNYSVSKSNGELLLGYGFCIADNPADFVMLTLKPPDADLQAELKTVHQGYFNPDGTWNGDKATFHLRPVRSSSEDPLTIMRNLPEPLLELLLYMLRHERGLPFVFVKQPLEYLTNPMSTGNRLLPHLARAIVHSIASKLEKLQSIDLPFLPQNSKQRHAQIYREGQIDIMSSTASSLRDLTRSYLRHTTESGPRLVTLEGLFDLWSKNLPLTIVSEFLSGIEITAGSRDLDELRHAGWEDDLIVLILCCMVITGNIQSASWLPDYVNVPELDSNESVTIAGQTPGEAAQVDEILSLIRRAASSISAKDDGGLWSDERWSAEFIERVGGKIVQYDSMMMLVPKRDSPEDTEPRLVIYIHQT